MGRGLSPKGRELIREAIERNGIPRIVSKNIEESIRKRLEIYEREAEGKPIRAYVNVGGGIASLGSSQNRLLIPPGLTTDLGLRNFPRKGVMILLAEKGVPVIHLNQIQEIARQHGLPVAPDYMPEVGEGEIFVHTAYNVWVAAALLVVYLLLTFALIIPETFASFLGRSKQAVR